MEPLYRPGVVARILREEGLRPNKALGQNFLVDQNVIERILDAAEVRPGDSVLEIGPGLGGLTQGLLGRGARVIAIEKDVNMVRLLSRLLGEESGLHLVHGDALEVDFQAIVSSAWSDGSFLAEIKVISNLPYYVTSPLLLRILESPLPMTRVVVMLQREVAARLRAAPGSKEYGSLTVAVSFYADVESVGRVAPTVFYPPPSVESEILLLTPRPCPYDVGDEHRFNEIVRAAFGKRRKTIQNALRDLVPNQETLTKALRSAGIDPSRRGETLSLGEFAMLSRSLHNESAPGDML